MTNKTYIINPIQALFGASFGIWYVKIVQTVAETKGTSVPYIEKNTNIIWIKITFMIGALIYLAFTAFIIRNSQIAFSNLINDDSGNKKSVINILGNLIGLGAILGLFLSVTYIIFRSKVSGFLLLFGFLQPFVLLFLEAFINSGTS